MLFYFIVYLMANVLAILFLIKIGGILPTIVAIIMLVGLIMIGAAIVAHASEKRKESNHEGICNETSGRDSSGSGMPG